MIQLDSKNISAKTTVRLNYLQDRVNSEATFKKKKAKAKSLWNNKGGSNVGKRAFEDIKDTLIKMCVSEEICNYCEQNEANDIEHINPKSFFPEFTFIWRNYLLACSKCNTVLKSDKCYVLDANDDIFFVERGIQPPHTNYAFINPRIENPNKFLILNMQTFEFQIIRGLSKKDKHKAEKTLEILELNERVQLRHARRKSAQYYQRTIRELIKILDCNTKEDLKERLGSYDERFDSSGSYVERFDFSQSLTKLKDDIKASFKYDIQTHQHPSVWYAIKTIQIKVNSKWIKLHQELPEAFTW